MDDCIFCKIAKGEIATAKVFENDLVFAFLDIHPIRPGHTLVIPKKHEPALHHLDDALFEEVMHSVRTIANRIEGVLHPKRVGLLVAGWDVPHAHVHIVPMEDYHDLTSKVLLDDTRGNPTPDELAIMQKRLDSK